MAFSSNVGFVRGRFDDVTVSTDLLAVSIKACANNIHSSQSIVISSA